MKWNGAFRLLFAGLVLILEHSAWAGTIEGRVGGKGSTFNLSDFVISVEDIDESFPAPKDMAVVNQSELRFVPRVLAVQAGATVAFPNNDPVLHNVFSISETKRFNFGLYSRGAKRWMKFDQPGVVELLCSIHLEMVAYVVVLKNPYFARTAPDGTYHIAGVPAGSRRVRCWSERFRAQERVVQVPETRSVVVDFLITR